MRGQTSEALEQRVLLSAVATTTLDMNPQLPGVQTSRDALVGEATTFSVTFDNTGNALGYGPSLDVIVNYGGADGVPPFPLGFTSPFTTEPDGLGSEVTNQPLNALITATTYGLPLALTFTPLSPSGVNHPFAKIVGGAPLMVFGALGEVLVSARLPFGSFADDQPPAPVLFTSHVSSLADVGVPLAVQARGLFEFGVTPADDAVTGDLSLLETGGFHQGAVIPQVMIVTKTNLAPEGETATGPNFTQQWQISVDVAAGQTINSLVVTDFLPASVVFSGLGGVSVSLPATKTFSSNSLAVSLTNPLTGVAGTDATITFGFHVREFVLSIPILNPATGAASSSTNTATAAGNWLPTDTRDHGTSNNSGLPIPVTGGPAVNTLADKSIAIQKSVAIVIDVGAPGPTPGDTLEYTLAFQVSDFFGFQNVIVDDYYSDGQLLTGTPTLQITTNNTPFITSSFTSSEFTAFPFAPNNIATDQDTYHLQFDVTKLFGSPLLGGLFANSTSNDGATTGEIRFRTVIQDAFVEFNASNNPVADPLFSLNEHDELFNSVTIQGELLNETNLGLSTGAFASDDSALVFQVPVGQLDKTIYAFNGSTTLPAQPLHVAPGDTVTFHLHYDLTTGDYETFKLTDFLPDPFFDATTVTTQDTVISPTQLTGHFVASLDGVSVPMTAITNGTSNSIEWTFPTNSNLGNTAIHDLDIYFTVTATHIPFADGLFLTNQGVSLHNDTHTHPIFATDILQVVTSEPHLVITKGVVATDNPAGVFSPGLPSSSFSAPESLGFRYTASPAITSANLAALIGSNLSNVDAGDLVTFVIAVENIGTDPQGAFDVRISDTLPAGFSIPSTLNGGPGLNLRVTDGTGAVLASSGQLFGAGLELTDPSLTTGALDNVNPSIPGKNIAFITFDLRADSLSQSPLEFFDPVAACQEITNTATLLAYASLDGGANTGFNFVTGPITDIATVTIACPNVTKTLVGSSIVNANNAADEAVIGEIVSYVIHLTVPEGVSPNVVINEMVPAGMAILNVTFVGALPNGVTTAGGIALLSNQAVVVGTSGEIQLGTITNADTNNFQPEVLTFFVNAVVLNVPGNQDGTQLVNQANVAWDDHVLPPISAAPITVIEPVLTVDKSYKPDKELDAGDTVNFTITVSNLSPSSTDAYDVDLIDILPVGFTYVGLPTFTGTAPAPSPFTEAGGVITAHWNVIPLGTSSTFTFQATLNRDIVPCQELTNTASTTWSSLPGTLASPGGPHLIVPGNLDSTERDGTGGVLKPYNDYFATDSTTVSVECPTLEKSIVTTSEASTLGNHVAIGEIVRYRLLTSLPEGTSPNFQIHDFLPVGMQFLDDLTAKVSFVSGAGFTSGLIGADQLLLAPPPTSVLPDIAVSTSATIDDDFYGDGTDVFFKLGTLVNNDNDSNTEYVVLEFNALVLNTIVNQAGVPLDNSYVVTIDSSIQVGDPSNVVTAFVVEPQLINIGKEYTSQTLTNGLLSATFDVSFSNANGPFSSTAFDTHVLDQLAPFLALTPGTLTVIRNGFYTLGPSDFVNNSNSGTVDVTINQIAPGDTIQLFYTVTTTSVVQPTQHIKNIANVTYTSLPGSNGTNPNPTGSVTPGIPGSMTGERDGSNAPVIGSLNDYFDMSMATITAASPVISKSIIATSNASTGTSQFNPLLTDLAVAEYVTYQLTFTLPAGTTSPLIVRDNLPTGAAGVMRYFSSTIVSIGSGIGPGTLVPAVVTDTDGDLINDQVAYNFGTRTVAPGTAATRQIVVQVVAQVVNSAVNRLGKVLTNTANLFYGLGTISTNVNAEVVRRSKPWWFENLTLRTGVDVPLTAVRANPIDASNMGDSVMSLVRSFVAAPNAALPLGIAVIGADTSNGDWQFSTDSGRSWVSILVGTSPKSATLLSAEPNNRVRFVPAMGFIGTVMPGLTYKAWDRSNGLASGTMNVDSGFAILGDIESFSTVDLPFSNAINTASIRVMTPVNAQVTLPNTANNVIVSRTGTGAAAMLLVRQGTVNLMTPTPINQFGGLQIIGGNAADTLTLDATLNGFYFGTMQFLGNGGNDVFNGSAFVALNLNDLIVSGGDGNDTLTGGNGPDNLAGGTGNDMLVGNAGNDVLDGGAGDDKLTGNAGNDQLLGGIGADTVIASGGMSYLLTDTSLMGDGNDTVGQIEAAMLTTGNLASTIDASAFFGSGTNTLNGGNGADVIIGSGGIDSINGGAGNDTLTGLAGADMFNGGTGIDIVREVNITNVSVAVASMTSSLGMDMFTALEGVNLIGTSGPDMMAVAAINPFAGTVMFDGRAGDDTLTGGTGTANLIGGDGNDLLQARIGSTSAVVLVGGDGADTLRGGNGADLLQGGSGADSLSGVAGNDTLQGGGGNDTADGGAGNDAIAGQEGDDMLFGGDGDDVISGGLGNDTLKGGIGNDLLIGGFGIDSLDGEAGNDTALGGQGKIGAPRFGTSAKDLGDLITAEVINELFATLLAFE